MECHVKFEETPEFNVKFGTVYNVSDGGYERGFAAGYEKGRVDFEKATQEKTVEISENGSMDILPDDGHTLSKVSVSVNVSNGSGGGADDLPSGYMRSCYIQFNAAQIIDTGIIGNQDTIIKIHYTRETDSPAYLYGCASSDNTEAITAYLGGNWRFGNKATSVNPSTSAELINTAIQNKTGVDRITAKGSYSGVTSFETIGTLLLGGARNANGTIGVALFVGKVFLFEVWQGEKRALKLIPVVSMGGVYRFYDEVSGAFFDSIATTPLNGGNL